MTPRKSTHGSPIRLATPSDATAIAEIERECFTNPHEQFDHKKIAYLITSPRHYVTVVDMNGQIMGWSTGHAWTRGKVPWGRVFAVAVAPRGRGQGWGRLLVNDLIAALRARGAERIYLEVHTENGGAQKLYESLGFAVCAELPNFYAPGESALRMVKVL